MIRTLLAAALTFTAVTGTPTPADDMEEPFGPQCAELAPQGQNGFAALADQPVATAISEIPQLSTLDTAVREAELTERLNEADDITVFAPTDESAGDPGRGPRRQAATRPDPHPSCRGG
jgi:uncharacterized surface protein with fasciclin (FAS1) repeats